MNKVLFTRLSTAVALLASPLVSAEGPSDPTQYRSQGIVIQGSVGGAPMINIGDTGPVNPGGGFKKVTLGSVNTPPLLSAGLLHSYVIAKKEQSTSTSQVTTLSISLGSEEPYVSIQVQMIQAAAQAICLGDGAFTRGQSRIAGLTIEGQPVAVSGEPNQMIQLPRNLGSLILNEQVSSTHGNIGNITVTAMHLNAGDLADLKLASAHADMKCLDE